MDKIISEIGYDNLIKNLIDPNTDLDYYLQYLVEIPRTGVMALELAPNPTLVVDIPPELEGGLGLSFANWFMRLRRHGDYRQKLAEGWRGPKIVSEGDSWFQYPTTLLDVIDHLMVDHAILSLGAAGDTLLDIENQREIVKRIKAEDATALLLSAGGNDLFEKGNLGKLIESSFPGAKAEDLVGTTFELFLGDLLARFRDLFMRVLHAHPNVHILIHGYCPAFPQGDAWIEKPLVAHGVPRDQHRSIVHLMLNKFNQGLAALAASPEFGGMVEHIDATHLGGDISDWHNEIHLNAQSSEKLAQLFRQALKIRFAKSELVLRQSNSSPQIESAKRDANRLSMFDEATLLRELDLRVELTEMDPSLTNDADMAPLVLRQPQPEIGIDSLRNSTRRLMRYWEFEIRELICGDSIDSELAKDILKQVKGSKKLLSGAIAAWIVSSPISVPTALASVLGAWLAAKVFESGHDLMCDAWQPDAISAPGFVGGAIESGAAPNIGEVRERFSMPDGSKFAEDSAAEVMDRLSETLQKRIVENPAVPVNSEGKNRFLKNAKQFLRRLGAETGTAGLSHQEIGGVEAVILADGSRPALYVKDDFIDLADPALDGRWRGLIESHEVSIRRFIASSGRIIRGADRSVDSVYGSAWMIDGNRVVTARHVLEGMTFLDGGVRRLNDTYYVDFSVEADRPITPQSVFRIESIDWASEDEINRTVNYGQLDAAVFRLSPGAGRKFPEALPLASLDDTQAFDGDSWILNVGHPRKPSGGWLVDAEDGDDRTITRAVLFELLGNKFGVKRFSPGKLTIPVGVLSGDEVSKHVFSHDATTLQGSSGSAVIALSDKAPVIGLHFAGFTGTRNLAHLVPAINHNWNNSAPFAAE